MFFKYRAWHCLAGQLPWAARAEELTINVFVREVLETTYCPADQHPTYNIQNYIHTSSKSKDVQSNVRLSSTQI